MQRANQAFTLSGSSAPMLNASARSAIQAAILALALSQAPALAQSTCGMSSGTVSAFGVGSFVFGPGSVANGVNTTSVGSNAGFSGSGGNNSASSTRAGQVVVGDNNTAAGHSADNQVTGDSNIAVGHGAGSNITANNAINTPKSPLDCSRVRQRYLAWK